MGGVVNVLDLFSGIGGFSLGLERAGMRTVAFCEIDPFCRRVLAKHWPGVPIYEDVRQLKGGDVGPVDVICGGFPCQDISNAGKKSGIDGERSGLWSEFARLIREIRPQFVIVENVTALLNRGMGRVLGDLAAIGYDAEWECIPACAVGAPHIRDRVWVLAYPRQEHGRTTWRTDQGGRFGYLFAEGDNRKATEWRENRELAQMVPGVHPGVAADWWRAQSRMDRSINGVPDCVERNCALGNAVVPQIPEIIGKAIMRAV